MGRTRVDREHAARLARVVARREAEIALAASRAEADRASLGAAETRLAEVHADLVSVARRIHDDFLGDEILTQETRSLFLLILQRDFENLLGNFLLFHQHLADLTTDDVVFLGEQLSGGTVCGSVPPHLPGGWPGPAI